MHALKNVSILLLTVAVSMGPAQLAMAATPIPWGQLDDFEDGTFENWTGNSILQNISTGGPNGTGDHYLRVTSATTPEDSENRHLGIKNFSQWGGQWFSNAIGKDYLANDITAIAMDLQNFGPDTLYLRLTLTGNHAPRYGSTHAVELLPDGQWHHVMFGLTEDDMTYVSGSGTLNNTLSDMARWVLHHDPEGPSAHAGHDDVYPRDVDAVLGVDNIMAVPEPSALMLLGTAMLALLLLGRRFGVG